MNNSKLKIASFFLAVLLVFAVFPASRVNAGLHYSYSSLTGELTASGDGELTAKFLVNVGYLTYVKLEGNLESVGANAFINKHDLKKVEIDANITSIGDHAFANCSALPEITLPSSVTSIGEGAFSGCSELKSINLSEGITSINDHTFDGCSSLTDITIPESVTSIGEGAFKDCAELEEITISDNVTFIGEDAFKGCAGLKTITIPGSVTYIGKGAFEGCSGLTSVTLPDNSNVIVENAFKDCSGLTGITIPENVEYIAEGAFSGCSGLTGITIPENVEYIADSAFSGCSGLTGITIPEGVESIGTGAFSGCSGLTGLTISEGVTSIGKGAFEGCTGLTDITIPESITFIGDEAFKGSTGIESVTIPEGIASFGLGVFEDCSGLTDVTIPDGTTSIADRTFKGCISLKQITLPETVRSIGNSAFEYCYGLTDIDLKNITSIGSRSFRCCFALKSITIPGNIETISDHAFSYCQGLNEVTISKGVKVIDEYAFDNCINLEKITIPDSVVSIGYSSFSNMTALTEVEIPDSVMTIDNYAFQRCTSIKKIVIPDSVTEIGDYAFFRCGKLETLVLPDNENVKLGEYIIDRCGNIKLVVFNEKSDYDEKTFSGTPDESLHNYFDVEYICTGNGKVNNETRTYFGDIIEFEMEPETDWEVEGVTFEDSTGKLTRLIPEDGKYSYVMSDSTGPVKFYVRFRIIQKEVIFCMKDKDDTIELQRSNFDIHDNPKYEGDVPTKSPDEQYTYTFTGWTDGETTFSKDETLPSVTDAVTYYAVFEGAVNSYEIKFVGEDGNELQSDVLDYGDNPVYVGTEPSKKEDEKYTYTFIGWTDGNQTFGKDDQLPEVHGKTTYKAVFDKTPIQYEIKFVGDKGEELQSDKLVYGDIPVYDGSVPSKKKDDKYTYTFIGWTDGDRSFDKDDELPEVNGNTTYTAVFEGTVNSYKIKFVGEDGKELQSEVLVYGETPVYKGAEPSKKEDDKYTYTFKGWTPEITKVTGDATYSPVFTSKEKQAVVTPDIEETEVSFAAFVERMYVVVLDRPSEPEGKAYWTDKVSKGELTGADCARNFLNSQEFKDRNLSDEDFVAVLYKAIFNRDAKDDPNGFNFWMDSLKVTGRDNVVNGFINSPEWCDLCAEYGIRSGAPSAKATVGSASATNFAARLYTECLGRDYDEDGLKFWSLGLTNLEITGSQAAHEFFYSAEFNGLGLDNKELITRMYKTFMGREPEAEGLSYWLDSMDKGMTKDQLFDSFVKSEEFSDICISYAIERG